jgi:uncharacterized membrane protein YidH (DUF202 family)
MADAPTIDDLLKSDDQIGNVPVIPDIDTSNTDRASVQYSQHRTKLSTHRTALSTKRTGMSTQRTDMSSRRTGMSFQRTRMSADRTLMSVIRTSLSLIGFGFTIYQFFSHLVEQKLFTGGPHAPRNFGMALIYLGIAMVAVGILYHVQFMLELRRERATMKGEGLIRAESHFPYSFTLLVAILLLLFGLFVAVNLTLHVGPFD